MNQAMVYVPMAQRHSGFHKPTIAVGLCTPRRCLVMLAATLVVGTVFVQCVFSFRHAFSDMHLRTDIDGELVVVSSAIAKKHRAVCLDGKSLPGYYFRRGVDEGEKKWLIVIPHSEWCNSLSDCNSRKTVPLVGTMRNAPVTHQFTGILSSNPAENQYFADWNMICLVPCDGAGFLGNGTSKHGVKSRGAAILAAVVEHLLTNSLIKKSEELVLYGEKSGAVSALAYTNYMKRMLPDVPKYTTVLHSGLLFDVESSHYDMKAFFDLHNIQGNSLISDCSTVTCLQADSLFHRHRTSSVIVYTWVHPEWPLRMLYGCDENKIDDCKKLGKYKQDLISLPARDDKPVKKLVMIITRCDWPFKTTPSNQDPTINGQSIYEILTQSLTKYKAVEMYVEDGNCSSANSG